MGRAAVRRLKLGRSTRFAYRAKLWKDRDTGVVVEGRKATIFLFLFPSRKHGGGSRRLEAFGLLVPLGFGGLDTR